MNFPEIFNEDNWFKKIKGPEPGPTSAIIGALHGNEVAGIKFMQKSEPIIDAGIVYLVGGNPRAYLQKLRKTKADMNRIIGLNIALPAYEKMLELRIRSILDQCDSVLDIHQAYGPEVFTFCEQNSLAVATRLLHTQWAVTLPPKNDLNLGSTDRYMSDQGKIGVCIEVGDMGAKDQTINIQRAAEASEQFLRLLGNIKKPALKIISPPKKILIYKLYKTKINFSLKAGLTEFSQLKKGDIIGLDGNKPIRAEEDSILLFAVNRDKPGEEAFQLARPQ